MSEAGGERTEQATDKRMKEVREKGQLSKSQDLTAWLGVGAAAAMMPVTISLGAEAATEQLIGLGDVARKPSPEAAVEALAGGLGTVTTTLAPMFSVVVLAVLAGAVLQGGVHLKKFKGKYEQFNPVTGMKQTFGTQALWNGAKVLMKTAVVGIVLYQVIQGLMPVLLSGGALSIAALLSAASGGTGALLQFAVLAGLALAFVDVFVVMKRNRKKTRMSKKEVKDENKNSEGDPLIKAQRRARQMAMSRNRMIAAVGDSNVVLINPTHVAVALKYEPGKSAPRIVATGKGFIAARIREEAERTRVPMVRDVPLARALHDTGRLGQEIPIDLYAAVAGVLAFVMALQRRGTAPGVHVMGPPGPPNPGS